MHFAIYYCNLHLWLRSTRAHTSLWTVNISNSYLSLAHLYLVVISTCWGERDAFSRPVSSTSYDQDRSNSYTVYGRNHKCRFLPQKNEFARKIRNKRSLVQPEPEYRLPYIVQHMRFYLFREQRRQLRRCPRWNVDHHLMIENRTQS